jgi:hypothetical protein
MNFFVIGFRVHDLIGDYQVFWLQKNTLRCALNINNRGEKNVGKKENKYNQNNSEMHTI